MPAEVMMEDLEAAIRHQLVSYLSNRVSLDEFTAWLVGATWNIDPLSEPEASQLAYAIELALAEHTSGLLTREQLRAELQSLSQQVSLDFAPHPR
jgi:hypothetical protein